MRRVLPVSGSALFVSGYEVDPEMDQMEITFGAMYYR